MNDTDTLPTLADLFYVKQDEPPWTPTPAMAAIEALTNDGDTFDLADGRSLRLRIEPDEGASINDYDSDGRVEWTCRHDYGHTRPDGFTGRARIIIRDGYDALWWEPYEELTEEQIREEEPRIRDLVEYGFKQVGLELRETVTDSLGDEHTVTLATEWIGGVDEMYPDLIADLASELAYAVKGEAS